MGGIEKIILQRILYVVVELFRGVHVHAVGHTAAIPLSDSGGTFVHEPMSCCHAVGEAPGYDAGSARSDHNTVARPRRGYVGSGPQ